MLYTLTLTDLATGWTECVPLLSKSAEAVLSALEEARTLFPFPLLGIDTDSGSEFLNAQLLAYCEPEHLTFTRGRPGVKNDQAHVEQKNGAVVRESVGWLRLEGVQAYEYLRAVYQVLRLVVNHFQPSLKLRANIHVGQQMRRVYDVAQTPLKRLLASGVLPKDRQRELRERVQQFDPLALSEDLDTRRQALWWCAHLPPVQAADELGRSPFGCALATSAPGPQPAFEEEPERSGHQETPSCSEESLNGSHTPSHPFASGGQEILALLQAHSAWEMGHLAPECAVSPPTKISAHGLNTICLPLQTHWEEPWPPKHTQREPPISPPVESHCSEEATSEACQSSTQAQSLRVAFPDTSSSTAREDEAWPRALTTLEQAIAAYLQEMHVRGRAPKMIEWHQTSLFALQQYLWRQFHLTDVGQLSRSSLQSWVTDLSSKPVTRTGARRTVSTVAAYVRSARAFCNWLVRQGYVPELLFPKDAIPQIQSGLPQPVESEAFARLLRACPLAGPPAGLNAGLAARNRAILWLLWDMGLQVAEVCRLRLADVDCAQGTVTVRDKAGGLRTFPLSADGQRAVDAYLEQARLTPAWEPVVPEARDQFLLTERRHPLTKNSLTMLFKRLSQRAGFSRKPICPSMLRDTYAIRCLQAGGMVAALQEQLGVADRVSVKRYQHFCEQQDRVVGEP